MPGGHSFSAYSCRKSTTFLNPHQAITQNIMTKSKTHEKFALISLISPQRIPRISKIHVPPESSRTSPSRTLIPSSPRHERLTVKIVYPVNLRPEAPSSSPPVPSPIPSSLNRRLRFPNPPSFSLPTLYASFRAPKGSPRMHTAVCMRGLPCYLIAAERGRVWGKDESYPSRFKSSICSCSSLT